MAESNKYIVTLDDDPMMVKIIGEAIGMKNVGFSTAEALLREASSLSPIAAFIDIHVGDRCGLDLIPELRAKWFYCPILVITSDAEDGAVVKALNAGADDFVLKPVRRGELLARLQARLNDHAQREAKNVIRMGDLALDISYRRLRGRTVERHLSETEVNLLKCLWAAQGTVVPRATLKLQGWGEAAVSDSNVDRKMHELRNILAEASHLLAVTTSYGQGFALSTETSPRAAKKRSGKMKNQKSGAKEAVLLDPRKIAELADPKAGGDAAFFADIVDTFLKETVPVFAELQKAVANKDCGQAKQRAHKLKGMCLNLGAESLADVCHQIEAKAFGGTLEGVDLLLKRYGEIFPQVEEELKSRMKAAA